ncbi:RHS repeat-associated core domain-containing protein [Streptosporangium jomthongense]|uniref:RHS repeat-associated core domain-containing protein n=1 Tax=Streptosporangium jomthongense TaxID=1193683 RepID=A0ABV8EYU3_9ACTN
MAERPDRVSAALTARLQGSRVLVTDETTESKLTYANPDSTFTTETVSGIARVRQGERWVAVDTTLIEDNGALRPRAAKAGVEFSAGGQDRPLARMSQGDKRSFALTWSAPLPKPVVKGNVATYINAAGVGADLVVTALPTGFRHDVVLRERPNGPVEFKLPVRTEGLRFGMTKKGGLKLTTPKGKVVASAPEPFMYDSSTDKAAQPRNAAATKAAIDTKVVKDENGQQTLVLKPDPKFLADPATKYPVTVDPTTTLTSPNGYTVNSPCTTSGGGGMSVELTPGISDITPCTSGGTNVNRALIHFDTSSLSGQQVVDARLDLIGDLVRCPVGQSLRVRRITSSWNPDPWNGPSVMWADQPSSTNAGEVLSAPPTVCGPTSYAQRTPWSIPVTAIAQAWAGGAAGYGLVLAPSDEPNRANTFGWYFDDYYTANPPKLVITYGATPWTGRLRAIPMTAANNKFYVTTLTPALAAEVNDVDGGVLKAEFQVEHDPSVPAQGSGLIWSGEVDNVTANAEAKITIPAGKLADGWTVRWRARVSDASSSSAWSQWQPLNVDVTAPTISYFDCNYPAGQWNARMQDAKCWLGTDAVTVDEFNADDINTELWWGLDDPSAPNRIATGWGWSQGKLVNDFPITPVDGWHTVYIKVRDKAHNLSQVTTHSFGVGNGGIATPADNSRTGQAVTLSAAAAPDYDKVRYEYRTRFLFVDYTVIPTADVSTPGSSTPISSWPQSRTDTSKNFADLTWNLAKTLHDAGGTDRLVEVRACFNKSSAPGYDCAPPIRVALDHSAFGGSYATAPIGPGNVALQTGDFSLTTSDAGLFGIEIDRTLTTLDPTANRDDEQLAENKVFGPGWRAGFPSVPSELTNFSPTIGTDSLQFVGPSGETLTYVRNGQTFTGVNDASDGSQVTVGAEELIAIDATGSKTTYTRLNGRWVVTRAETPAAESAVTYYRDVQGRVTRVLAPVSAGITCGATLVTGCRALELGYASSTTATGTGSGWGDYTGQVKQVSFTAFDPATNAMKTTTLATYLYDSTGHLRQVTDPRTNLATTYYYTAEGRLSQLTPPGLAPWRLEYDTVGRLAHVQREGGTVDPTWAVAYNVPIGGTGAPINLTVTETAKWGQNTDLPTTGTAIFPASHLPPRGSTGAYQPAAGDWEYGQLIYTDVNGRLVNSAAYGAGVWQITSSRYDDKGNTVWHLSADNRAQALTPTADTSSYVAARLDTTERADLLARITTYSADSDILTEIGPARLATLASGELATVRDNITNVYDEGKPTADTAYHLVTTTTTTPLVLDRVADENDKQTVTTGYDPLVSGDPSGWTLRKPTTSSSAQKSDIVQRTRYDAAGRQIERRMAESNGADAGTTAVSYYTAAAHPTVTACGNKPQWAGLTCQTAPKSQPPGTPLPIKLITYGYYGNEVTTTQTSGAVTRTTTLTYDAAGRSIKSKIDVQPASASAPIAEATYTYDPATGLQTTKSIGSDTISMGYDSFGRANSTTDATGVTSTAEYNLDGQIATSNDGKGVTTFTYGGIDAKGRVERRNLITQVDTGGAGVFTGAYDIAGRLVLQRYPDGLEASSRYDNAGKQIGLSYVKNGTAWLSFTAAYDLNGRIAAQQGSAGSAQRFDYDGAGRLTKVQDTYGGTCATRIYGFDRNTNRTSSTSYPADNSGSCSTTTAPNVQQHHYDAADRITDVGYTYDNLGRTTRVPSAQVSGGADLEIEYFVNDKASVLTQGSVQSTFTLDPGGRIKTMTTIGGPRPGTVTHHYSGTEDSPTWISEADGTWTRNVPGLSGLGAIQNSDGTSTLQLINLHGDVVATSDNRSDATGVRAYSETTEFGTPRAQAGDGSRRYGWLGSHERSSDAIGGLIFMGARLYNPQTGRFLQTDPIPSGSANAYDYCSADPINKFDLDGTSEKPIWTNTTTSSRKERDTIADNFLEVGFAAIVAVATKPVANWWAATTAGLIAGVAVSSIETTVESVTTTTVNVYLETRMALVWDPIGDLTRRKGKRRSVPERRTRTVTTVTTRWRVITVIIPKFNAPRITEVGPWFTRVTVTTTYSAWKRGL